MIGKTFLLTAAMVMIFQAARNVRCPMPYYAMAGQPGDFGSIMNARRKNRRAKAMKRRRQ